MPTARRRPPACPAPAPPERSRRSSAPGRATTGAAHGAGRGAAASAACRPRAHPTVRPPRRACLRVMPSPFEILFEPVQIGPVTARNRFFQVPHCNGMGYRDPAAHAAMRGVKAEGGWAVVCTEEVEIHPSTDVTPYIEGRLWDDSDIAAHALLTDAVHAHGSLAGIELVHSGPS